MAQLNVAIGDDNERILEILGEIVSNDKELNLVGKANNGEEMYQIIKNKQPDVVLLDLIMPKMDGLSVMELVNEDKNLKKSPNFFNLFFLSTHLLFFFPVWKCMIEIFRAHRPPPFGSSPGSLPGRNAYG